MSSASNKHMPLLTAEFPDFDHQVADEVTTSWGFEDQSWRNDMCPSFCCDVFVLWIDYADPSRRTDDNGPQFVMQDEGRTVLATNEWEDVRAFVEDGRRDFWPWPMQALVREFQAFQKSHGFQDADGDAHELLMGDLTPDQRAWLSAFCQRWDEGQAAADRECEAEARYLALLADGLQTRPGRGVPADLAGRVDDASDSDA